MVDSSNDSTEYSNRNLSMKIKMKSTFGRIQKKIDKSLMGIGLPPTRVLASVFKRWLFRVKNYIKIF